MYPYVFQAAGTSTIWNKKSETTAMCDNKLGTTASGLVRSRTRYEALLNQSGLVWLEGLEFVSKLRNDDLMIFQPSAT